LAELVEDVTLDATQAFRVIDEIGSRLSRAAVNFGNDLARAMQRASSASITVTANTQQIGPQISGAVDAADTEVLVTAETGEVTGDVSGAVDAADSEILVTADASPVTPTISGAVDAADSEITVTADASGLASQLQGAGEAAESAFSDAGSGAAFLGGQLAGAAASAGVLRTAAVGLGTGLLAAFSADAIVDFTNQAIDASRDLVESTTKAQFVFDEFFPRIERFAETSSTAFGIARRDAIEMTATFGNLLQGAGLTAQQSSRLSLEIVKLGSDLASFNNIAIEGVDGALAKLAAALVGEIEPIRRIGITFNAAQVEAEAFRLGLANANGELDQGAKILARWSLIQQQAGNAQGDFARTSENLANQQRILTAEIRNVVAEIGTALLPVVLNLVSGIREALPAIESLGVAFVSIIEAGLGVLVPLLEALGTAARVTAPFLNVLADAVSLIAEGFSAIPLPIVVGLTTAIIGLRAAAGSASFAIGGLGGLASSIGGRLAGAAAGIRTFATSLLSINTAAVGITAAITIALAAFGSISRAREAERRDIEATREALGLEIRTREDVADATEEQAKILQGLSSATQDFLLTSGESEFVSNDQIDDLERLGLTAERLELLLQQGGAGLKEFAQVAVDSGEVVLAAGADLDEGIRQLTEGVEGLPGSAEALGEVSEKLLSGNEEVIQSFIEEQEQIDLLSKAFIENERRMAELTDGQTGFTDAQIEAAFRLAESETGYRSNAAAADILKNRIAEVVDITGEATVEQGVLLNQLDKTPLAIENNAAAWNALGVAIGQGTVDAEDFQRIARRFGVTEEVITNFAAASTEALDDFAASLTQGFVGGEDIIGDFVSDMESAAEDVAKAKADLVEAQTAGEGVDEAIAAEQEAQDKLAAASDPQRFIDNINKQRDAVLAFNENIAQLIREGNTQLAREALEAGPVVGGALAQSMIDAEPQVRAAANQAVEGLGVANIGLQNRIRNEFAPQLAGATGFLFSSIAAEMGIGLLPAVGTVTEQLDAIKAVFGAKSPEFRAAASLLKDETFKGLSAPAREDVLATLQVEGEGAATRLLQGYQEKLDAGMVPVTQAAFEKIPIGIRNADNIVAVTAGETGTNTADEFGRKGRFDEHTRTNLAAAQRVLSSDTSVQNAAGDAGARAANDYGEGADFAGATRKGMAKVPAEIAATSAAVSPGARASGSAVGVSMGAGIAQGVAFSGFAVNAAVTAVVNTAINLAEDLLDIDSPSRVFARIGEEIPRGMAQGITAGQSDVDTAVANLTTIPEVTVPNLALEVDLIPNIAALEAALAQRALAVSVSGVGAPAATAPATAVTSAADERTSITFSPTYNLEAPEVPTVVQLEAINRKQGMQISRLGRRT
jgi:hypothetical protein